MSVSIRDNRITMTRGDTLRLQLILERDGEIYEPVEGDSIRFAVKHPTLNAAKTEYVDTEPLIEKTIPNETLLLVLDPSDTKPLGFGKYDYDIQITLSDGTVDTFISDQLKLTKEVE